MTAKDILLYQVGNRAAIERVASSPATFLTGLLLVLITGIPRNYDQIYFLETWRWLYGPLALSLVSGSFVFTVARFPSAEEGNRFHQWLGFMGLFWMTAPFAWVYAIPLERMLPSRGAAIGNLCLLALVSLGRVLLLSRVLSIAQGSLYRAALVRVLFAASIELWLVALFGGVFGTAMMAGMAGMRNAPEEELVISVLALLASWGWIVPLLLARAKARMWGNESSIPRALPQSQFEKLRLGMSPEGFQPVPCPGVGLPAGRVLLASLVVWIGIAVAPQMEQRRFVRYDDLTRTEGYRAGLAYLSTLQPGQLPPQRRLRPSPYEYEAWTDYPKCFAAMDGAEPAWVAQTFRQGLEVLMSHRYVRKPDQFLRCLEEVARIDQGTEWIDARRTNVARALRSLPLDNAGTNGAPSFRERLEAIGIVMEEPRPTKPAGPSKPEPSPAARL